MTEILVVLLVYTLAKIFGDTCHDRRLESWLGRVFVHIGATEYFLEIGGNLRWNPSLPWTCGFWHLMEHVKVWCVIYLALGWFDFFWLWKTALALVLLWTVGQVFELVYGYALPYARKGTLAQWFTRAVCFWKRDTI